MTNAAGMPGGHGHNYGDAVIDGWAAVIPPDGWTPADTDRVKQPSIVARRLAPVVTYSGSD